MATLKREWLKVADIPGAPFRGSYADRAHLLPVKAGQTIRIPKDTKLFRVGDGAFLSKRTYRVKVHHVLTGITSGGVPKENPQPRWPGTGGYWTDADINDVEVEGSWVWFQEWAEFERGWGQRRDGFTLHVEKSDVQGFLQEMRAIEQKGLKPGEVPDEYSNPEGKPFRCFITDSSLLDKIEKSQHGVWWPFGNVPPAKQK